ncbi:hypothetical protein GC163_17570 [bacterium]|nr:hypothetical protein [bacterium]
MSACITLLTDFGHRDTYVGEMHAVIAGIAPQARVIDLTHDVSPQNVLQGAILLANAVDACPAGTIHVAVVDPGVGSSRAAIAVQAGDRTFIAPDNGLLTVVLQKFPQQSAVELTNPAYHRQQMSATFHGRDLFSPVAAHLANGVSLAALGPPITLPLVTLPIPEPQQTSNGLRGEVLWVDHFGNLITNLPSSHIGDNVASVHWRDAAAIPLVRCYADADVGTLLALIGSSSRLEVAVRNGSAADVLQGRVGDPVVVELAPSLAAT